MKARDFKAGTQVQTLVGNAIHRGVVVAQRSYPTPTAVAVLFESGHTIKMMPEALRIIG